MVHTYLGFVILTCVTVVYLHEKYSTLCVVKTILYDK